MTWDEGHGGFTPTSWTNWVGNQRCEPAKIVEAGDEDAIVAAVRQAADHSLAVRTPGTGHSFTPNALSDGILLNTRGHNGIVAIEPEAKRVIAKSHTTIGQFGEPLWASGLSLKNQGDIDTQAIAGAIATSTHGSGKDFQSFSGALRACRLVDGRGEVRTLSVESNPELFGAVQTSLGMLGIMTEVTVEVMDAYHLHEQIVFMPAGEVIERWDDLIQTYRHFSFFWMPTDGSSVLYGFPEAEADMCMVKLYQETDEEPGANELPDGERTDRAYRIYPHVFEPNFHELEYFMPAEESLDVFLAHRRLMLDSLPDSVFPMEVRFVARDDAWISPNYQRDSLVISVSGKPGTDYWPYLRTCDQHLLERGGRPHWGKLHFSTAERLSESFPRYEDFKRVRREFDPKGIFLNDHLRPLFE
ncbi:MAG: D-arabinono-1,4-lactone oxidase [Pseudomonadota bacterium]